MKLVKDLLKKHLLRHLLLEADPQGHFKERVKERVNGIVSIDIPSNAYVPNTPKEAQDRWIINQIKKALLSKIDAVLAKQYPNKGGVCVLVPLGFITVKPLVGETVKVIVHTNENKMGSVYNVNIYDNRATTFILTDPRFVSSKTPQTQLAAHMYNNKKNGWPVNEKESFVDESFMTSIVIDLKNQVTIPVH